MAEKQYEVTETTKRRLERMMNWSDKLVGPGVTNTPFGPSFAPPEPPKPPPPQIEWAKAVKVTTAPSVGLPKVAGVKLWLPDRSDVVGSEFYVELIKDNGHAVGESFYVVRSANLTAQTDILGDPVLWTEMGGGTGGAIPVYIRAADSGGGEYVGRSITVTASTTGVAPGALTMPPGSYAVNATDDLLLYHPLESGLATHSIPVPCYALAYDTGTVTNEATPRKIYQLENIGIKPGSTQYHVLQMVTATTMGWGPTKAM